MAKTKDPGSDKFVGRNRRRNDKSKGGSISDVISRTTNQLSRQTRSGGTAGNRGGGGGPVLPAAPVSTLPNLPIVKELVAKGILREGMDPTQVQAILAIQGIMDANPIDIKALMDQLNANYEQYTGDVTGDAADWMKQLLGANTPDDPAMQALFAQDPLFTNYAGGLEQMQETAGQNLASDQAWFLKQQQAMNDYYNTLMTGISSGTIPVGPELTGGGGGGGGGGHRGGGRRHYGGGGGSGGGDGDLFTDPRTRIDTKDMISSNMTSTRSENYPDFRNNLLAAFEGDPAAQAWIDQFWATQGQDPQGITAALWDARTADEALQEKDALINESNTAWTSGLPMQVQNELTQAQTLGIIPGDNPETPEVEVAYQDPNFEATEAQMMTPGLLYSSDPAVPSQQQRLLALAQMALQYPGNPEIAAAIQNQLNQVSVEQEHIKNAAAARLQLQQIDPIKASLLSSGNRTGEQVRAPSPNIRPHVTPQQEQEALNQEILNIPRDQEALPIDAHPINQGELNQAQAVFGGNKTGIPAAPTAGAVGSTGAGSVVQSSGLPVNPNMVGNTIPTSAPQSEMVNQDAVRNMLRERIFGLPQSEQPGMGTSTSPPSALLPDGSVNPDWVEFNQAEQTTGLNYDKSGMWTDENGQQVGISPTEDSAISYGTDAMRAAILGLSPTMTAPNMGGQYPGLPPQQVNKLPPGAPPGDKSLAIQRAAASALAYNGGVKQLAGGTPTAPQGHINLSSAPLLEAIYGDVPTPDTVTPEQVNQSYIDRVMSGQAPLSNKLEEYLQQRSVEDLANYYAEHGMNSAEEQVVPTGKFYQEPIDPQDVADAATEIERINTVYPVAINANTMATDAPYRNNLVDKSGQQSSVSGQSTSYDPYVAEEIGMGGDPDVMFQEDPSQFDIVNDTGPSGYAGESFMGGGANLAQKLMGAFAEKQLNDRQVVPIREMAAKRLMNRGGGQKVMATHTKAQPGKKVLRNYYPPVTSDKRKKRGKKV